MEEPDEPRRQSRRLESLPLDGLGVAELQSYIEELKAEIARAENAIAGKQEHRAVADGFFRKP